MDAHETLEYLLGSWRVHRTIFDHLGDDEGTFEGVATFTRREAPEPSLHFEETGDVCFGSYKGSARRQLDYVCASERFLTVNFVDGRHFFDLDLTHGSSTSVHLCNVDRYEITTVAQSTERLEERWHVVGPQKDYDAVTTLERIS